MSTARDDRLAMDRDDRSTGGGLAVLSAMLVVLVLLAIGAGGAFYFWYSHSRTMRIEAQLAAEQARMAELAAVNALAETRAAQAKAEAATTAAVGSLILSLKPDGQIQAGEEVLTTEQLVARLEKVAADKGSVSVYASPEVPTERITAVLQQVREAGIAEMHLGFPRRN